MHIELLADWIRESKIICVLTGAGISTESGIPDYRSSSGIWTEDTTRQNVMSLSYFKQHRVKFWAKYKEIFQLKLGQEFHPNYGHNFLSDLELIGKKVNIFTQNVDGLHQEAGSSSVFEVHGNMRDYHCFNCDEVYDLNYVRGMVTPTCLRKEERFNVCNRWISLTNHPANYIDCDDCGTRHWLFGLSKTSIRCKGKKRKIRRCKDILKPDVVLFQEGIRHYDTAKSTAKKADLFIVLGTSLEVGPINEIPLFINNERQKSVIINRDPTELDNCFQLVINDSIGSVFKQVNKLLMEDL